jgi:mRNA interferase MazF
VAGILSRGEVRLCRFAPPDKQRPVLILTRNSAIGHLATVTVAPITSTIRDVPSEVILDVDDGMKCPCAVNLHNAVTVAQARLGRRVASRANRGCRKSARLYVSRWDVVETAEAAQLMPASRAYPAFSTPAATPLHLRAPEAAS